MLHFHSETESNSVRRARSKKALTAKSLLLAGINFTGFSGASQLNRREYLPRPWLLICPADSLKKEQNLAPLLLLQVRRNFPSIFGCF